MFRICLHNLSSGAINRMLNQNTILLPILFGTWLVFGITGVVFFLLGKNAQLKRKLWPFYIIGIEVILVALVMLAHLPLTALFVMIPVLVLAAYLNLTRTKFCDSCGATILNQNFLTKTEFCTKCGERVE